MRKYEVHLTRTKTDHVFVEVTAESEQDAIELVLDGICPAQWPDGNYAGLRTNAPTTIKAREVGK
jgi:hypothetical protein